MIRQGNRFGQAQATLIEHRKKNFRVRYGGQRNQWVRLQALQADLAAICSHSMIRQPPGSGVAVKCRLASRMQYKTNATVQALWPGLPQRAGGQ